MRPWPVIALLLPLAAGGQTPGFEGHGGGSDQRGEAQMRLPQYPKQENYLPFEVSANTPFAFFIDAKSLSVDADNVVRYSVIAKSPSGALNISYEGMRCVEREFRIYALGRADNTWSVVRESRWKAIRLDPRNAQRAVLYTDFFCPVTSHIESAEEAVQALKSGGNPRVINTDY